MYLACKYIFNRVGLHAAVSSFTLMQRHLYSVKLLPPSLILHGLAFFAVTGGGGAGPSPLLLLLPAFSVFGNPYIHTPPLHYWSGSGGGDGGDCNCGCRGEVAS
jgi:hypothetical protein